MLCYLLRGNISRVCVCATHTCIYTMVLAYDLYVVYYVYSRFWREGHVVLIKCPLTLTLVHLQSTTYHLINNVYDVINIVNDVIIVTSSDHTHL